MILQEAHDMYILSYFSDSDEIEKQDCFLEPLSVESKNLVEDNKATFIQKTPENAIKIEKFKFQYLMGITVNMLSLKTSSINLSSQCV